VRGRKRHIVVDTLGFLLVVMAHPADIQDRPGAVSLLAQLQGVVSRLAILYADSGYAGPMVEAACGALGCHLVVIAKDAAAQGFHVLPKRWIVERTLAWLGRNRRLSKDYEHLPAVSEAFVKLAMIRLMTDRGMKYTSKTHSDETRPVCAGATEKTRSRDDFPIEPVAPTGPISGPPVMSED